jgi:hypothetical protein
MGVTTCHRVTLPGLARLTSLMCLARLVEAMSDRARARPSWERPLCPQSRPGPFRRPGGAVSDRSWPWGAPWPSGGTARG